MAMAYVQSAALPSVVESMMMPMATPMGVEMANANAYEKHDRNGLFGSMRKRAIPMAIAAKILCSDIVHKAFHESAFVSAYTYLHIRQNLHS